MREKFTGIVKSISPEQSGTSKSGNGWKRKDLVLYNADPEFSKTVVVFTFLNEKVKLLDDLALQVDDKVQVEYYLSADEYKERWIPKVTALSVVNLESKKEDREREVVKCFHQLINALTTSFAGGETDGDNSYGIITELLEIVFLIASKIEFLESEKQELIALLYSEIEEMEEI